MWINLPLNIFPDKRPVSSGPAVDMNQQKQEELSKERDELARAMEEMKLMDEEEKRRYVSNQPGCTLLGPGRVSVGPELVSVSELVSVGLCSQKQSRKAYEADLKAQMRQQQQLRCEQRAEADREYQQGLIQQELYNQKKDEILSRPTSHTTAPHPFRRAEGSKSASTVRST